MRDSATRGDSLIDARPDVRPAFQFTYNLIDRFPRFTIPVFPPKRKPIYIWSDAMFVSGCVDGINYSKEPVEGSFGRHGRVRHAVLIPMNVVGEWQWTLAVIILRKKQFVYYDSLEAQETGKNKD